MGNGPERAKGSDSRIGMPSGGGWRDEGLKVEAQLLHVMNPPGSSAPDFQASPARI